MSAVAPATVREDVLMLQFAKKYQASILAALVNNALLTGRRLYRCVVTLATTDINNRVEGDRLVKTWEWSAAFGVVPFMIVEGYQAIILLLYLVLQANRHLSIVFDLSTVTQPTTANMQPPFRTAPRRISPHLLHYGQDG